MLRDHGKPPAAISASRDRSRIFSSRTTSRSRPLLFRERYVSSSPFLISQVVQLIDTIGVRHGLMLVGPTGGLRRPHRFHFCRRASGGGGSPGGKTCNYRLLQATSIAMCEVLEQWVAWSIDILEITSQSPACTRFLAAQKLSGRRLEVPEGADAHPEPQSNHPGRAFGAHNVTRCKRVGPGVAGCSLSFRPSSTEPSTRSLESGRMEWPVSVSNAELRDSLLWAMAANGHVAAR